MKFYYNDSPNPMKVALFLEESGLDYELIPIDPLKGEQFRPEFLRINPNAKVPALVDGDAVVFDSNAILLYLAEKTGKFLPPPGDAARGALLSWLMFVATGIGPYSGQAVHFKHRTHERIEYAHKRYQFEVLRHYMVLNDRLKGQPFILGDIYTIVDMAAWGWARIVPFVIGEASWERVPEVKRWVDSISARPAAARAVALESRYEFKAENDAEARSFMFRHTVS